jgi:pyridoxal 5'-phosphate synthase pdxT subunit
MSTRLTVGVLALQGDFERHLYRLNSLNIESREVRTNKDLENLDGLIIPGGESTTMSELIDRFDMREQLTEFCKNKAVWGTCAGLIMLATKIDNDKVKPLNIIDLDVIRNGYGRQVHSSYAEFEVTLNGAPTMLKASFIRAPIVRGYGADVNVIASYQNDPVLLSSGKCLVSSFHTELHDDLTLTKYFLEHFIAAEK